MAINFENIFYDRVIKNLQNLIAEEFKIQIYYDEHKGNQSFLITPESDTLISNLSNGIQREYEININYQLKIGGQYTKNNFKQVSSIMERLKRLINNNLSYNSGATWFDANINSIEYERDEDDQTLLRATGTFNCNNIEVL